MKWNKFSHAFIFLSLSHTHTMMMMSVLAIICLSVLFMYLSKFGERFKSTLPLISPAVTFDQRWHLRHGHLVVLASSLVIVVVVVVKKPLKDNVQVITVNSLNHRQWSNQLFIIFFLLLISKKCKCNSWKSITHTQIIKKLTEQHSLRDKSSSLLYLYFYIDYLYSCDVKRKDKDKWKYSTVELVVN